MYDVVALGELLIDFASLGADESGYPTMAAHPGGAPGNFLAALNAFGAKTGFLGKVGDDAFGQLLLSTLKDAGIETKGIVVDPAVFTTLAFVTFDDKGDRSFSFARKPGADTQLHWEEVDQTMIDEAKVFHFGTLSLTDEPCRTATRKAVAYAKEYMALTTEEGYVWGVIRTAMSSVSDLCVIQMQDFLNLGAEARMNFPGTLSDANWTWRAEKGMLTDTLAEKIGKMTRLYNRSHK